MLNNNKTTRESEIPCSDVTKTKHIPAICRPFWHLQAISFCLGLCPQSISFVSQFQIISSFLLLTWMKLWKCSSVFLLVYSCILDLQPIGESFLPSHSRRDRKDYNIFDPSMNIKRLSISAQICPTPYPWRTKSMYCGIGVLWWGTVVHVAKVIHAWLTSNIKF